MKKLILLLYAIIAFIIGVEDAQAATTPNTAYTLIVSKSCNSSDTHRIDDTPFGHRVPPKPIICTINSNGTILLDNDTTRVSNIYIYDDNDYLIATLSQTIELIDFFNHSSGVYYIYLITDSGSYVGQVII